MSNPADDLVIVNQAKALEGMRQRLKSHMRKLTERQHLIHDQKLMIDKMEQMIARRDDKIAQMGRDNQALCRAIKQLREQVPESYNSELTRKCQELAEAKEWIEKLEFAFDFLLDLI